jgi:hypothetical protein
MHEKKTINLGFHISEEQAARVYDKAARVLRGDQAHTAAGVAAKRRGKRIRRAHYLNFPTSDEEKMAQAQTKTV